LFVCAKIPIKKSLKGIIFILIFYINYPFIRFLSVIVFQFRPQFV